MRAYAKIWISLVLSGLVAAWLGGASLALLLFPIPVAVFWACGQRKRSLGLVFAAAVTGGIVTFSATGTLYHALVGGLGVLFGVGIVRQWRYGRIAGLAATAGYAIVLGHMVWQWDATLAFARAALDAFLLQASEKAGGADESVKSAITWFKEHWAQVGPGSAFWLVLAAACVELSMTGRMLRRNENAPKLQGSFKDFRPSEWLVWGVIAVAALWFVDHRWPEPLLRLLSWNASIALLAVYCLNGVSILVYAFSVLQPNVFLSLAALMMVFMVGLQPMLCFLGLFDTWADFRGVFDKLVIARQRAREALDKDRYDD